LVKLVALTLAVSGCAALGPRDKEIGSALTGGYRGGESVAVLLPQSGRFADAAQALKDGILAAQGADAQGKRPKLRFYDTGDGQAATSLVQKAAAEGAVFVIGPLQKNAVEDLTKAASLPVPVLALNRVSGSGKTPANLYQFSLSPEHEAAEVAQKAWDAGHRQALVLHPNSPWGDRMARAFLQKWKALGGQVAATETFDPNQSSVKKPISNLAARAAGANFLFLAATAQMAREIAPQIRTLLAADLPVFSTSHIFSGSFDAAADSALVGVHFVDIPWLVESQSGDPLSRESLKQRSPGMKEGYSRLYAMGIDAYRLPPRLGWMQSRADAAVQGKTGRLTLDSERNVVRGLTLARMGPTGPAVADLEASKLAASSR